MKNFLIKYILIIAFFTTSNCGFKVLDKTQRNDFVIKEITSTGDKKINYEIKNNLSFQFNNSSTNIIILEVASKKNKSIKEKNIKNKITKYQIQIDVYVKFHFINQNKKDEINFNISGDYRVAEGYSATLSNEKKLNKSLAREAADKILDGIKSRLNDI